MDYYEAIKKYSKVYVLRIGHRPQRDKRITTHVGLVARAFGANGFILGDICDENIIESLKKVQKEWGGSFTIECGVSSRKYTEKWKEDGGEVIHLTMYGMHVDDLINDIRNSSKPKLIIVGAEKVPSFFYQVADYNVAIGNQPHSEVAALAIFLDRLFRGEELRIDYPGANKKIIPTNRGKRIVSLE